MLHEPEHSLVAAWLAAGGTIVRVPFGISGNAWSFHETARRSGLWGLLKMHRGLNVESAALAHIAAGELTLAQARAGEVWTVLRQRGPMYAQQLSAAMQMNRGTASKVLRELVAIGAGEAVANTRLHIVRAVGDSAPHWRAFIKQPRRVA